MSLRCSRLVASLSRATGSCFQDVVERLVGVADQAAFDDYRASRSEAHAEASAAVEKVEQAAQRLLETRQSSNRGERRIGAKQFKRKAQVALNEASNRGDALIFKSDRGRDALRLLSSSAPTEVDWTEDSAELNGAGVEQRRKKQRVYEGVTMPVADPARKVRVEQKLASRQQSAKERGFSYLLSADDSHSMRVVQQLDAKATALLGLRTHPRISTATYRLALPSTRTPSRTCQQSSSEIRQLRCSSQEKRNSNIPSASCSAGIGLEARTTRWTWNAKR